MNKKRSITPLPPLIVHYGFRPGTFASGKTVYAGLYFLLFLFFLPATLCAQKDSLVLKNGNFLVGEIKGMEQNVLTMKTPYSDQDFKVKYGHVKELYSERVYLITLSNGSRLNASITTDTSDTERVLIRGQGIASSANRNDVVYFKPVEKDFLSRLSASIDLGYNYTRNNNLQQYSASTNLGYLANFWNLKGSYDAVRSSQDEVEDISRTSAFLTFNYFLGNDWFALASADFLQNDEQRLKLRSAFRLGIGKYIIHTNQAYWGIATGANLNNEQFTGSESADRNSAEAFIGTSLDLFNVGDLDLLTNLTFYPSITEENRLRADFKFDMKYDLPLDFYIRLGYTHNFDNQPADGAASHDFIFRTSIGWSL